MASNTTTNAIADARIAGAQQAAQAATMVNQVLVRALAGATASPTPMAYGITAVEPAVPEVENSTLTFDAQRDKIIAQLSAELDGFFTKYYPLAADAFDEATNWLVNSITNGGTGISEAVEDQIWQRGRDRIIADGMRAESQTLTEFASRGFSLPSGAMAARLQEIRFEQLGKTQELSRDAAIKQADMTVENLRFAVNLAIDSRMKAMQAAADYIRSLMAGTDTAAKVASINSDAKARMMGATSDLYRARLARDELAMKIPMLNQEASLKVQGMNIDGYHTGMRNFTTGAVAGADAFARAAAAAYAAVSAIVSSSESSFT